MAKKIRKKDIKGPDEFQTFSRRSIIYVSENRDKFLVAAGVFILIILSFLGWNYYRSNYEANAAKMHLSASGSDNNEKIEIYKEVAEKYPRSNAALISLYNMGNIYFKVNDIDNSIDAYEKFIEKASEDNLLATLARIGLAYCYEAKGDFAKAIESLNSTVKDGIGSLCEATIYRNMARIYEEMNKPKEALDCYKKVLNQTTDPVTESLIKRKISTLAAS